jgi:hypothetical protein
MVNRGLKLAIARILKPERWNGSINREDLLKRNVKGKNG